MPQAKTEPEIGELSRLTTITLQLKCFFNTLVSCCIIIVHFLCVDTAQENHVSSDEEEEGVEVQLELVEQTLGTLDLREFELCPSRHQRRRRKKKKENAKQNDSRSSLAELYYC